MTVRTRGCAFPFEPASTDNIDPQLRRGLRFAFYDTSRYDFEELLADVRHVAQNLRNYIAGFSPNMREVLEKFDFDNTISELDESLLLLQVVQRVGDPKVDLHPDAVDNGVMAARGESPRVAFESGRCISPDKALFVAYWAYATDEQRSQARCIAARMQRGLVTRG